MLVLAANAACNCSVTEAVCGFIQRDETDTGTETIIHPPEEMANIQTHCLFTAVRLAENIIFRGRF